MAAPDLPQRALPGVVTWKNELGFKCVIWYYLSDPAKRGEWADVTSASIPGGRGSDHWRQEQEIDPFLVRGRPTYYGFAYHRNVIAALPVEMSEFRRWTWFLSADYGSGGGATCWLFWAEEPGTGDLIIFDEVYVDASYGKDERTPEHVKPLVYDRLRYWSGTPLSMPIDIRQVVKYAIGDPTGLSYSQEYRKSPMPIYVGGGSPDSPVKINDVAAGEARLNAYCSASFVCCATADNPEGRWYVSKGVCPKCGSERVGRPRLRILKEGAPKLIAQLPTIRKKLPKHSNEKAPDGNVRVEDHAEASARYGAMSRPVVRFEPSRDLSREPKREQSVAGRFWSTVQERTARARAASLWDEDEGDPLASIDNWRYDGREGDDGTSANGPY